MTAVRTTAATTEGEWRDWLERLPRWRLPAAPTVVVSPHPDDESLGAGGLIAYQRAAGLAVRVVAATDGEAAYPGHAGDLAARRTDEQTDALARLGGAEVIRVRLADGQVAAHEHRLVDALEAVVAPTSLLVAPFERDGHPDHDACGRAARRVAAQVGACLVRFPIWAWHWSRPDVFATTRPACLELDGARRQAKAAAIASHRSQIERDDGEPILPAEVLAHFSRAQETYLLDDD